MHDSIATWHEEHANFSRLLDLLEDQAKAFQDGDPVNYELMADIVQYLGSFGDRVHHLREDAAYARLVQKDPGMTPLIRRLLQEHRVIGIAGQELRERLDEAVDDVMFPRATLEAAIATYLTFYRSHLLAEECQVLPQAANLLSPQDWDRIWRTVPRLPDPLFGETVQEGFLELRRQIEREPRPQRPA